MSEFEDDDPEEGVSDAELGMLRDALAVDPASEPSDALWEHLVSSAISGSAEEVGAPSGEPESEPVEDEVAEDPVVGHEQPWDADQIGAEDDDLGHHEVWSEHHDHHGDGS
ncbi:hypothetical protein [Actinomycetospora termitidis]|uniref:Uncharacterized protein n=1 Tax=Actinomycetospora termitidis TaxID=3053470 RepID=A0ABT7MGE5_9PSEU|nr:hypothetical protein [Actinomycetospora sp. Odt1-22]MDL5158942.1 hypothetical protein [Actinomycetospora sp. Odt1-22]